MRATMLRMSCSSRTSPMATRLPEPSAKHLSYISFTWTGGTMDFAFREEHEELRRVVRDYLADKSPETEVRRLMESERGYDPVVWAQLADQLGLQGLAVPQEYGGAGLGALETGVVMEEMGRALLCAPYLSTAVLAVQGILASGDS